MAHFAKLDNNNKVIEVHVVDNAVLDPENEEASGIAFLTEWSGGHTNWKQTSYTKKIRKNYAGPNFIYDEQWDAFIPPQPFPSWKLNYETFKWYPPIPAPEAGYDFDWRWSEINQEWVKVEPVKYEN